MIKYMDETNILERMNEYIRKNEPVLVHCYAGMQRSCAVVACYLIKYYGVTPSVAMDHIKKNRPVAFFGEANFKQTIQHQYLKDM
jgi:protein-tyrosine phosphatase